MKSIQPFGYIYLITSLINGKVYIGKTESTINQRWYTHRWRANHLDRVEHPLVIDLAISKYGESSFEIKELDKDYSKEDLLMTEAYWIRFYDATNPDKGYNIDPMEKTIYSDDFESIWEIRSDSDAEIQKKAKWQESLIKKKIASDKENDFLEDLKKLSGVQLEKKYGLYPNRRALLREIRRILNDDTIETIEEAKQAVGIEYNLKKQIQQEKEDNFVEDFKKLSGVELEQKYSMNRRALVRNIKRIFKERDSQVLDEAKTLTEVQKAIGGKYFDIEELMNKIPSEREQEFKSDIRTGLTQQKLFNKYGLGTYSFYRELKRLCGIERLTDIREHAHYNPPIKEYISLEKEKEFKEDLKELSGVELECKYGIPDRRILLREIRRILNNESLQSMKDVKLYVGGEVYNSKKFKKCVSPEREVEFKNDVKIGLTRRGLCEKYDFGTKVLYRELKRLFDTDSLEEARRK